MQLTIKQAADLMQVRESLVRRWIRDRGLPAVLFNEQYHLNRLDLLAWAQTNQVPVPAHVMAAPAAGLGALHDALVRGGIHRDLEGATGRAVLLALLQRLSLPAEVDRDLLLEMVLARETQSSTSVGHGIAIPHARYPIVTGAPDPLLALGFASAPVVLGKPGSPEVRALFLVLAPTIRSHLQLVARLARGLGAELLAPVEQRAGDDAILAAARAADADADAAGLRSPP